MFFYIQRSRESLTWVDEATSGKATTRVNLSFDNHRRRHMTHLEIQAIFANMANIPTTQMIQMLLVTTVEPETSTKHYEQY